MESSGGEGIDPGYLDDELGDYQIELDLQLDRQNDDGTHRGTRGVRVSASCHRSGIRRVLETVEEEQVSQIILSTRLF